MINGTIFKPPFHLPPLGLVPQKRRYFPASTQFVFPGWDNAIDLILDLGVDVVM